MTNCLRLLLVLFTLMISGSQSQTTIPLTRGDSVQPSSYLVYQSNQYDRNLPCLQDGQCNIIVFDNDDKRRSAGDNLLLLNCIQPSALFDGTIGTEIRDDPEAQDLLIHYAWQAGLVPHPFVAMTFNPPLELLTGVTLYLYQEGRLDIQAPYISMCVSSSPTLTPRTNITLPNRPRFDNGVVVYDIPLETPPTSVLFLNITFEHERRLGIDLTQWIFLSEVQVSGRKLQAAVSCVSLNDPENGNVTCPSNTSVFQDTCTYYCNRGYQLEGNRQTRCSADGTWSSEPVTCTILTCNDPEVEIPNSQSVGDCSSVTYGSSCLLNCSSGHSVSGNGEHVCDDVNDEGTSVKWRSVGGDFSCVAASRGGSSDGLPIPIIAGAGGGAALFLLIIICIVVCCVKRSRRKKDYPVKSVYSNSKAVSDFYIGDSNTSRTQTMIVPNALYDTMNVENDCEMEESGTSYYDSPSGHKSPAHKPNSYYGVPKGHKSISSYPASHYASPTATLQSTSHYDAPCSQQSSPYYNVDDAVVEMESVYEYAEQSVNAIEDEQKIYETPCDDDGNHGPIYAEPPTEIARIFETYEGKRFHKIYHRDIQTLQHLGSGEFGVVTLGLLNNVLGDIQVAVKSLNTDSTDKDKLRFIQEAAIMCQFDHKNVVKLYGVIREPPTMIVLEYMSQGDLRNFLHTLRPSSEVILNPKLPLLLLKFCREIAAGMFYLTGKQFVHRDLAARNVLVSEKCVCKIADFGMSRDLLDENYYITSGGMIPIKWTAPEALHYKKYSIQSDVWSYGCVLYEIWSLGYKPFQKLTGSEALQKVDTGYRLPPPPGCPQAIYRVMVKCWHPDPRSRPQFGQITKLLAGNGNYLLGWSDEDKQVAGEDGMKLGAPLECSNNLYSDLQTVYCQSKR